MNNSAIYIINLPDALDRRKRMASLMDNIMIPHHFISALDGNDSDAIPINKPLNPSPLLGKGEIGCIYSHILAWETFSKGPNDFGIVLEDDIIISPFFSEIIHSIKLSTIYISILKIESFFSPITLFRDQNKSELPAHIYKLKSAHAGSAGYIINKPTAHILITFAPYIKNAIDIELFFAHRRSIPNITVYQLLPALCAQYDRLSNGAVKYLKTQIGDDRADKRIENTFWGRVSLFFEHIKVACEPVYGAFINVVLGNFGYKRIVVEMDYREWILDP